MFYNLDKRDKEILSIISNNARLSYNQIAKLTHISKDSVRNRIINLEKEGVIISYFPLLNYSKIGVSKFNVYCKLKSSKYLNKKNLKNLVENNFLSSITWLMGEYELELQIMARNKKEMSSILKKTELWENIREYKSVIAGDPLIYSTNPSKIKYLSNEIKEEKSKLSLTPKEIELIEFLSINAREKIVNLAEKLDLGVDEVRYLIRKLVKQEIILGFYARTSKSYMGTTRCLILTKTKEEIRKKETDLLKNIKNIFYLKKCHGSYDYLMRFYSNSNEQLINTIHSVKDILSENLSEIKVHTILEIIKTNPSPKILLDISI